jgi:hypothetical protein
MQNFNWPVSKVHVLHHNLPKRIVFPRGKEKGGGNADF